jgi:hypothetical protein
LPPDAFGRSRSGDLCSLLEIEHRAQDRPVGLLNPSAIRRHEVLDQFHRRLERVAAPVAVVGVVSGAGVFDSFGEGGHRPERPGDAAIPGRASFLREGGGAAQVFPQRVQLPADSGLVVLG